MDFIQRGLLVNELGIGGEDSNGTLLDSRTKRSSDDMLISRLHTT